MAALSIIMLAGSLRPSPLRAELDESALRMPLRSDYRLLDAWLDALAGVDPAADLRIVVTDLRDIDTLNGLLARQSKSRAAGRRVGVVREPRAWRGTAGLVRDLVEDAPRDACIAVLEAACLPLLPLQDALSAMNGECSGVIVAGRDREPAGISVFKRAALDRVSPVGYSDMKEQFIPALHQQAMRITLVERDVPVQRIRDRRSYLHAVAASRLLDETPADGAATSGAGRRIGPCAVEQGAVIAHDAIIHESVLMSGCRVEAGAVVSRSVIGRGAIVAAGERIIEHIVARELSGTRSSAALPVAG